MRVLVCGGRKFADVPMLPDNTGPDRNHPDFEKRWNELEFVHNTLNKFAESKSVHFNPTDNWLPSDITIISGKAKGADTAAIDWAVVHWCDFEEYPADWDKYGNSAGPIRNHQMLKDGKPDIVIAFPGGTGTEHMVGIAKEAGIEVIRVLYP